MKIEKRLILPIVLITILSAMFLASTSSIVRAQASAILAIAPSSYSYIANFTSPPSSLTFNISLTNVTTLGTWQTKVSWDQTILSFKNASIPSDNIFGSKSVVTVPPDTTTAGTVIYGSALLDPAQAVNGSGILFTLELNVVDTAFAGTSNVTFAGVGTDTFLLDGSSLDIPFTSTGSSYSNSYVVGTVVTHTISGSTIPVTTTSNGTIQANSTVIDIAGKTISFNVTGNTGDTAFIYIDFPKNVINVTGNDITRWNVTANGAVAQPQITQTATDTFMFAYITFGSDVTIRTRGDNIIPEFSSVLIMLMIASFIAIVIAKSRIKKNL